MVASGKEFITNFRNARFNPLSSSPALLTRGDIVKVNRAKREAEQKAQEAEWKVDEAHAKAEQEWVDQQVRESAPLREEIKQASGGKVTVDESIYNKTSLQRILNTVQKMQQQNNGTLFPGYTVISNTDSFDDLNTMGESTRRDGTKESPHVIKIKYANDPAWGDYVASGTIENGWWPKTGKEVESPVHTHELSHTAQYETYKKDKAPSPAFTYEQKEALQNFIASHPSIKQIFYDAATRTGHKTLEDAAKNVSGYAYDSTTTIDKNSKYFPELFAEAYTDVLYNGNDAAPYSKELIKLYVDYINDYNNTFKDWNSINRTLNMSRDELFRLLNDKESFIRNLRKSQR